MARQIDIKKLNALLIISFFATLGITFTTDIVRIVTLDLPIIPWYLSNIHPFKVVTVITGIASIVIYSLIAFTYRQSRKEKKNSYLAFLVYFSAMYQSFSRTSEVIYLLSESTFTEVVYVAMKFYLPLDILSAIMLSILAFDVFYLPSIEAQAKERTSRNMFLIGIAGIIIGIVILFFHYMPTYSPAKIIIATIGIGLLLVIAMYVVRTTYRIFKLWIRTRREGQSQDAIACMGVQLLLSLIALIFFTMSETLSFVGVEEDIVNAMRLFKNIAFLFVGILYYPSFVKPARTRSMNSTS